MNYKHVFPKPLASLVKQLKHPGRRLTWLATSPNLLWRRDNFQNRRWACYSIYWQWETFSSFEMLFDKWEKAGAPGRVWQSTVDSLTHHGWRSPLHTMPHTVFHFLLLRQSKYLIMLMTLPTELSLGFELKYEITIRKQKNHLEVCRNKWVKG